MSKVRVFFDMDGVMAEYEKYVSIDDFSTPGYFRNRPPVMPIIKAMKYLVDNASDEIEIGIDSKAMNNAYSKIEKMEWLNEFCSFIKKENIYFADEEKDKSAVLNETYKSDILIDDYTPNLEKWHGIGIKFLNGINNTKGTWKGYVVSGKSSPIIIAMTILAIARLQGENNGK